MTALNDRFIGEGVGERIRTLRLSKELTLRQVANRHISSTYLDRIETGKRVPSLAALIVIAEALATTALELALGRRGECPYCGRNCDAPEEA